jgi:hypothetical protein
MQSGECLSIRSQEEVSLYAVRRRSLYTQSGGGLSIRSQAEVSLYAVRRKSLAYQIHRCRSLAGVNAPTSASVRAFDDRQRFRLSDTPRLCKLISSSCTRVRTSTLEEGRGVRVGGEEPVQLTVDSATHDGVRPPVHTPLAALCCIRLLGTVALIHSIIVTIGHVTRSPRRDS